VFIDALSAMPDSVLLSALDAKRADHECISLRLALANAEVKSSERRMLFLSTMRDQHVGAHAVSGTYLDMLDQILSSHDLEDIQGSKKFYTASREEQVAALAVSEAHVAQVQDAIGLRFSRWLEGHGSGKDPEDPFDVFSDSEEGSSDESADSEDPLSSPAPMASEVYSQ
jgi:hypothetical protein